MVDMVDGTGAQASSVDTVTCTGTQAGSVDTVTCTGAQASTTGKAPQGSAVRGWSESQPYLPLLEHISSLISSFHTSPG